MNLTTLATLHGTDKLGHGYIEYYEQYLPKEARFVLEIGVAKGASALMWNDYYGPDTDIHLADLFQDPGHVSPRWCRDKGFVPHIGNQADINSLYTIKPMFDVIIDDGSHRADHMQITFKHLFVNNLKSGGIYVIEDLHCCRDAFYWAGGITRFEDTILSVLQRYKETGELAGLYFDDHQNGIFKSLVDRVEIANDKIAFIWKK